MVLAYGAVPFKRDSPRVESNVTVVATFLRAMFGQQFLDGQFGFRLIIDRFRQVGYLGRWWLYPVPEDRLPQPDRPIDRVWGCAGAVTASLPN